MSFKQNQRFYQSQNQPSNPNPGDEWLNTTTNRNYQFLALSGNAPVWVETAIAPTANVFALNNVTVAGRGNFVGNTSTFALNTTNIVENVSVISSPILAVFPYNIASQTVVYVTASATGNFIVNIKASDTALLNNLLTIGQSVSLVLMVTNGGTAYYVSGVQLEGVTTTAKWLGGSAPSSGNINSVDSYTFTVVKTANATFTVFASQTKFA